MRSYIGITAHFVEDFKLQSVMLACRRFKGSHTAENILSNYQQIISSFNLDNKVVTIITDNAANMQAFVTLPGAELDITDSDSDSDSEDTLLDITDIPGALDYLPEHIPCFCHTLQLCVNDGLNKASGISTTISKASRLVSHVRHSALASDILADQPRLQARNSTRWNSTNNMLKSLLKFDTTKLDQLTFSGKLTNYDMKIIQEIIDILSPFETATKQCEGQNIVTASLVIPCISGLKAELSELSTTHKSKLLTTLLASVDTRLAKYEDRESFQLATILDPRFKVAWCTPDEI